MTGGQHVDGPLTVPQITLQVHGEGAKKIAVVTDEPEKYPPDAEWAPGVTIHHRDDYDQVQREFREIPGMSVIIYDQTCAAEKRRRRKRNQYPDPLNRTFIKDLVCEGCGDCGVKSNCVSVLPLETEFGRKRMIDQSSCNKDFSCVKGFCPSFVTVHGGGVRKGRGSSGGQNVETLFAAVPEPQLPNLDQPYGIMVTGVGGTGVVTIGAIVGMAAHVENKGFGALDMAGLAQKGGAVWSHLQIAARPEDIKTVRLGSGGAKLVLGCDFVVSASQKTMDTTREGTRMVVNTHQQMTGEFTRNANIQFPGQSLKRTITKGVGEANAEFVEATRIATALIGDSIATNLFMLGYAFQKSLVPVSSDAINKAIELNGAAVKMNQAAFLWGRRAAVERSLVHLHHGTVQFDGFVDGIGRNRHQTFLERVSEHEQVGRNRIAYQRGGDARRLHEFGIGFAHALGDGAFERLPGKLDVRVASELSGHLLVRVHHHARAFPRGIHGLLAGRDHEIAAQHQLRPARAQTHRLDVFGPGRDLQMAPYRTALLCQASHVQGAETLVLQVRRHADDRADGHHAGPADAGDHDAVRLVQVRQLRFGHCGEQRLDILSARRTSALAHAATMHRDEAGAETLHTGEILVAGRLIDHALAAELGFQRQHGYAVRLDAAVAATFAYEIVDEGALGGIGILIALAPAALFRGTGLVVNDDRHARYFGEFALHLIIFVAMMDGHAGRPFRVRRIFFRLVSDNRDFLRAFAMHLQRDLRHRERAVDMLPAGHRDLVVVENLLGDIHTRSGGSTHRQQSGMVISAVADVLEHMRCFDERCFADPACTLTAHLRIAGGAAIHELRHEVTANARQRARTFGYEGAGIVRTAGTEVRRPIHRRLLRDPRFQTFLLCDARAQLRIVDARQQPASDRNRDLVGIQRGIGAKQDFPDFVTLADHLRRTGLAVEHFLQLRLDQPALFLHDDDFVEAFGEFCRAARFQRPRHADLVDAKAKPRRFGAADTQILHSLTHIHVGLAAGCDAQLRVRRIHDDLVELVGQRKCLGGLQLVGMQSRFLLERRIRPADVEPAFRHFEIGRHHDVYACRIDID